MRFGKQSWILLLYLWSPARAHLFSQLKAIGSELLVGDLGAWRILIAFRQLGLLRDDRESATDTVRYESTARNKACKEALSEDGIYDRSPFRLTHSRNCQRVEA